MRYGDLTYLEVIELAQAGFLAIVPLGCTEQQGPHLPTDLDTYWATHLAEAISEAAAARERINALVIPTLPFGPTPEHRGYGGGYVDLPQPLHEAVIYAVLSSLADQGFQRLVLLPGCGQHDVRAPLDRFNEAYRGRCLAMGISLPLHEIWCRIGDACVSGGHADSFATSIAMYLRPASVRRELVRDPGCLPVDWDDPNLDFGRYSRTGVIGDPTHASAELGALLWAAVIESGVQSLVACAKAPLPIA
ncbi:MAG: creatininase family protein [Anaerolineae bacterium]